MSRRSVAWLLAVLGACMSQPRYIVTSAPLKVIDPAHPGLCIAIDPNDPKGIWWRDGGYGSLVVSSGLDEWPESTSASGGVRRTNPRHHLRLKRANRTPRHSGIA